MKDRTGLIYSDRYLEHDTGPYHPESPRRLKAIMEEVKKSGILSSDKCVLIKPREASIKELELVHDADYISYVREACRSKLKYLDSDTPITEATFEIAQLAAGGLVKACEDILAKKITNAFALVRPPGHHAGINGRALNAPSLGFCIFNNVAIAAAKLVEELGLKRVAILDFDCHHGNGTQEIFYRDRRVLCIGFHQDGRTIYPGSGFIDEVGEGDGEGYNVNVPFPPASGDEVYVKVFNELATPIIEQFSPEFILVSAGFDGHYLDPLTNMKLTSNGYRELFRRSLTLARKYCSGRLAASLEGGYGRGLPVAVASCIAEMAGADYEVDEKTEPTDPNVVEKVNSLLEEIKAKISSYWNV